MQGTLIAQRLLRPLLSVDIESPKLSKRLGLTLMIPIAIAIVVAFSTLFAQRRVLLSEMEVANQSDVALVLVERLHGESEEMIGAMRGILLSGDTIFDEEYKNAERNVRALLRDLSQLFSKPGFVSARPSFEKARAASDEYLDSVSRALLQPSRAQTPNTAFKAWLHANVRPKREAFQKALDGLRTAIGESHAEQGAASDQTFNGSLAMILAFSSLALGAAAYIAFLVAESFVDLTKRAQLAVAQKSASVELLKRSNAELELVGEQLRHSNRDLELFASVASHDLREPLRTIGNYVGLLARKCDGMADAEAKECMSFIQSSTARMRDLIEKLLEYARAGKASWSPTKVDVQSLVEKVLANLKVLIAEKGATVTARSLPVLMGEETQLGELFQNLIVNAIKYNRSPQPKVEITAERKANRWVLTVRDNGIGINSADHARIFDAFQRLHNRAEYAGSGLGLAVCKRIVEAHGGSIRVESTPGEGAAFHVSLPA
jgi:signal transduction histidine kinase